VDLRRHRAAAPDEWLTPTANRVAESRVGTGASLRHEATPADGCRRDSAMTCCQMCSRLLHIWATSSGPLAGPGRRGAADSSGTHLVGSVCGLEAEEAARSVMWDVLRVGATQGGSRCG